MPNAVLEHLEAERSEQVAFVDELLNRVQGRDLVQAEVDNLTAARQRIAAIDAQLAPLREFEQLRGDSAAGARRIATGRDDTDEPRPLGVGGHGFTYASAGAYIVDHLRARGNKYMNMPPDPQAEARLRAALQDQTTTDTPGLLPTPIVGPVVNTIDASRPFITSIGVLPLPDAGAGFIRPKITQHVDVGLQVGEKTELPSRKMVISQVPFSKKTFGGAVDISRQDIDWTSPAAWDSLVQDLADVYGAECEQTVAVDFATLVTQSVPAASADLTGWVAALYEAAAVCYMGGAPAGTIPMGRLPDRLWVSLDMWGAIGSLVDVARMAVPPTAAAVLGDSNIASFSGDILAVPRVVVPSFATGTVILGPSTMYEFRETVIGLLTAVEPSRLGMEVAYGGYCAYGMIEAKAYCKVTPAAPLGTTTRSKSTAS